MTQATYNPLKFLAAKAIAVSAKDIKRAHRFYREILNLEPHTEDGELIGYKLGETIIIPKENWYAPPTEEPNPRVTLLVQDAHKVEAGLKQQGVRISDPVAQYGSHTIGSFLDSEGNKLWFCSELN